MADAVIVGGGPGGLAAGLFAARRGHRVTVLERDPMLIDEDADPNAWPRRGVAQARQGHVFLGRAREILRQEAPEVLVDVFRRGAAEAPLCCGGANVLSRRLVFEAALRAIAEKATGVTILSGRTVAELTASPNRCGLTRVSGVRTAEGEELHADLVVDASGRRSQVRGWLRTLSVEPPVELVRDCGFFYVTRHYRLRPGESFPSLEIPIVAPLDFMSVLAFPGDNGHFQISMAVAVEDPCRRRLLDGKVFERVLAEVPLTRPWIQCGTPISEPQAMGAIENRRRTLLHHGRPVVTGLALLGDASMQTNPTTGRGITLALLQAQHLANTLEHAKENSLAFAVRFEEWTEQHLGPWFQSQIAIDSARLPQLRAAIKGNSLPPATDPASRMIAAMAALREEDSSIRDAVMRLYNLLITPAELRADPRIMRRIVAYLRTHPTTSVGPKGPNRLAFERIVAA